MKKEVHSYESGIRRIQEMLESQDTPGEIFTWKFITLVSIGLGWITRSSLAFYI